MIDELLSHFETETAHQSDSDSILELMKVAFAKPVKHPPLIESIFPGDQVGVLIQNKLPCARNAIEALISVLETSRIETSDILIVVPASMKRELRLEMIAGTDEELPTIAACWKMGDDDRETPLRFEIHDIENEHAACYLALNKQGDPIFVNRSLANCDIVLPLSCLSPDGKQGDCLYPEFSNLEIRDRFRKKEGSKRERTIETELANNSLGLFFSIELICRPGGQVDEIICGAREQVRQQALDSLAALWHIEDLPASEMIVATVESGEANSWASVMRAATNAATLVPGEGPIIVWSELNESPKAKVRDACGAQFEGSVSSKLPIKYQRFASILFERSVYLKSALTQNTVEELGLGFVDSAEAVARIARPFENPVLIRDAHLRTAADPQEAAF